MNTDTPNVLEELAALRENQARIAREHADEIAARRAAEEVALLKKANSDGHVIGETLAVAYAPDGHIVACKEPPTLVYEQFRRCVENNTVVEPANQYAVVNVTRYYPDQVQAQALFMRYPHLVEVLAIRSCNLICEREDKRTGKS